MSVEPAALSLPDYIQSRFDGFSRSQKDVAQYIVDHLDEVAFQTAEELARRANTSSSTVVRFSQALGFEGYPELQGAAREEFRRRHARHAPGTDGSTPPAPLFALDQTPFEAVLAGDHVNVEETARKASRAQVAAAVERGVSAGRRRCGSSSRSSPTSPRSTSSSSPRPGTTCRSCPCSSPGASRAWPAPT